MSSEYSFNYVKQICSYPFKDPKWFQKVLVGCVLILLNYIIPVIPGIFVYGYVCEIFQRMISEKCEPFLPEWNDFGRYFKNGIRILGISIIYLLPAIILTLLYHILGYGFALVPQIIGKNTEFIQNGFWLSFILLVIVMLIFSTAKMFLTIIIWSYLPAALSHATAENSFLSAFNIRAWWRILKANIKEFLIVYLIIIGYTYGALLIFQIMNQTVILCLITPFLQAFTTFYYLLVISPLLASAYKRSREKLNAIV